VSVAKIRSTLKANQVRRKLRQAFSAFVLSKSIFDCEILSLNPSKLAQLLPERVHEDRATGSSACIEETYAKNFPWLLRPNWKAKRMEHGA
jgi:hypothetical protein